MATPDSIPATLLAWHRAGARCAMATVVETWGSAPRPTGSQLAISEQGEMVGSVSGGCVEGAVVVEALESLEDGEPRLLNYGVSDDDAFAVGLACGGTIRILVEPVGEGLSSDLLEALSSSDPVAYWVDTVTWERGIAALGDYPERFRADISGFEGDRMVTIYNPPLRMVIVGAVHIAQALADMAATTGYAVTIVDPRPAFASEARFPGHDIVNDWPDVALESLEVDARTAIVTLSHDPKLDDPALSHALGSPAFYVGALGSTRTHAKRVARLVAAGFSDTQIARIHAPVGLDIGARTPAEIATSALAEITQTLRKPA